MTLLLGAAAGYLAGRLLWLVVRPGFLAQPLLVRTNYRGRPVVTAVGVVVPLALLLVEAGRVVSGAAGIGDAGGLPPTRLAVVVVVVGLGLLGTLDDLVGTGDERGFRGHLRAMAQGRLTTGGVKLVVGLAVALLAVADRAGSSASRLLADAALVALAANLANLFDRAPGRATKVGATAFLALAAATGAPGVLATVAVVVGAAAALLMDDLRERIMLGDAGANALGGVLGLGVVLACAPATRNVALLVLLALNLASELVSFSRVIDHVAPLRALDRAGRSHPRQGRGRRQAGGTGSRHWPGTRRR